MLDANTEYLRVYEGRMVRADDDRARVSRLSREIHEELREQCKTLEGALRLIADLDDVEHVLAGVISGTSPVDGLLRRLARSRAEAL